MGLDIYLNTQITKAGYTQKTFKEDYSNNFKSFGQAVGYLFKDVNSFPLTDISVFHSNPENSVIYSDSNKKEERNKNAESFASTLIQNPLRNDVRSLFESDSGIKLNSTDPSDLNILNLYKAFINPESATQIQNIKNERLKQKQNGASQETLSKLADKLDETSLNSKKETLKLFEKWAGNDKILSPDEIKKAILTADENEDGKLSFDERKNLYKKLSP